MTPVRNPVFGHCTPRDEIAATLKILFAPDEVFELRVPFAFDTRKVWFGFFDNPLLAAERVVAKFDTKTPVVYAQLNALHPDLLARGSNKFVESTELHSPSNGDHVTRRRWLLIDADATHAHHLKINSTNAEHEAALLVIERIFEALVRDGWPEPIVADSGNGGHLLFPFDLVCPNEVTTQRLKNLLKRLANHFDTPRDACPCAIDTGLGAPHQLTKLYGTASMKADNVPERPYRRSHLLYVPDYLMPAADDAGKTAQ